MHPQVRDKANPDGPILPVFQVLLKEKGFLEDVVFGNTKVFIRSPSTLFKLEQQRYASLPVKTLNCITHRSLANSKIEAFYQVCWYSWTYNCFFVIIICTKSLPIPAVEFKGYCISSLVQSHGILAICKWTRLLGHEIVNCMPITV